MQDTQTLNISKAIKNAVESVGGIYHGGSYGNHNAAPDAPLLFRHNYTLDGEKFCIQLAFNDFDLGPFEDPNTGDKT